MFIRKNKNLKNNILVKRAFSIGEVMLSVFILGVTMLTILTMYASGLREFQDERDSVIASLLAQEGVELVRNIRDNNWANRTCSIKADCAATFPDTFANLSTHDEDNCRVDYNDSLGAVLTCGSESKTLNLNGNYYSHNATGGTATKFRRTIHLDFDDSTASSSDDVVVTSFVSWDGSNPPDNKDNCGVSDKCVFSESTLRDWGTGT